jgi:tetratricopeptide (TPR) repeat protein
VHVPGWHEATKDLQDAGRLQMVGIIQEQHPDRARLFMQWKKMGWPILVDSYNLLGVRVVPITLAIDEHGVIRQVNPPRGDVDLLERTFLTRDFEPPETLAGGGSKAPDLDSLRPSSGFENPDAWMEYADALAVWGGEEQLDEAIDAYATVVGSNADDAMAHFRTGVAYRMRYDSDRRQEGDFNKAVRGWATALEIDPNQYIFRRRIQQYGPRLDKPYSFYDWVNTARAELEAEGETPSPLVVEPRGAEFAQPAREFMPSSGPEEEPDPRGRVLRDEGEFIRIEVVAVPPEIEPGATARFHVVFQPVEENLSHWNNEAEELGLWLDPPRGWEVEQHYLTHPLPAEPTSGEPRIVEVEVRAPDRSGSGPITLPAYALYYVCEDVDGLCLYRRQDLELQVNVRGR